MFEVNDLNAMLNADVTDILWTYDDHASNDAQPRNVIVDRAVANLYLADAQAKALELNREEQYEEAQKRLRKVAQRIARYAGSDPELLSIIAQLSEREAVYSRAISPTVRRQEYFASTNVSRMRTAVGRAQRGSKP